MFRVSEIQRTLGWLVACLAFAAIPLTAAETSTKQDAIAALGRLEPGDGIRHIAAPNSLQGPSIVFRLFVREGQSVTNGQPLAHTHTYAASEAAWKNATALVEVAKRRLAVAEAGVKSSELSALAAELERERADLVEAGRSLERIRQLGRDGAVSAEALDQAEARFLTRSNNVNAASQRWTAGSEVRPVDVAFAKADLAAAEASAERALREWEQTIIRAPVAGEVLHLHVREGEQVGEHGLLDFGETDRMGVRAEVYESDVRQLKAGQRAEVTGEAFAGVLTGKVELVGRVVKANRLLNPNPAAFADARVVEVRIRLDKAGHAAGLSGALVNVRIFP
jgi:HlyD family secretion protein